jgi:hypothetical protein
VGNSPEEISIDPAFFLSTWRPDLERSMTETPFPPSSSEMAPEVGFEPTTNRLTADRSTTELLRSVVGQDTNREPVRFKIKMYWATVVHRSLA